MAPQFVDAAGRRWAIRLSVGTMREIRDLFDLDLLALTVDQAFALLGSNAELLVDCVWAAIAEEAKALDVDVVAFARSIDGDCLQQAHTAFLEALANFSPTEADRAAKRARLEQLTRWRKVSDRIMAEKITKAANDPDGDRRFAETYAELCGTSSTKPPES